MVRREWNHMDATDTRFTRYQVLKASVIVIGASILVFAVLADRLGIGQPGSFGVGQFMLALVGVTMILIGWLEKRVFYLYRNLAIILLNTLILFSLFELGAIIVARIGIVPNYRQEIMESYKNIPYYTSQYWADEYFLEAQSAENYRYRPYVIWSHQPYGGELVNVDDDGNRVTPGAECSVGAYKVFAFGGSTMWGWGSPDRATIPAYLQKGLDALVEEPVCVVNFGEDGYVSTQSLISLVLQLQSGNIPDLVIFYDGVNDVYAAYESGGAGTPVTLAEITAKFEGREHPLIQWIKSSRLYALVEDWALKRQPANQSSLVALDTERIAVLVTEVYLKNYELVATLGDQFGFDYYFFWQPHHVVGHKPLTAAERAIKSRTDPALDVLANAVYHNISLASQEYLYLRNLANIFDLEAEQIWIDEWGHITPEGNHLVAKAMLDVVKPRLVGK